jgi:hypothetical protein
MKRMSGGPLSSWYLFGASRLEQLESNLTALTLAAEHGRQLRAALDKFWLDRDGVPAGWL